MRLCELHTCHSPWRPPSFGDAGIEITDSCESPDVDSDNQSHILCRAIRALNHQAVAPASGVYILRTRLKTKI